MHRVAPASQHKINILHGYAFGVFSRTFSANSIRYASGK
jgi:hypothetical protein